MQICEPWHAYSHSYSMIRQDMPAFQEQMDLLIWPVSCNFSVDINTSHFQMFHFICQVGFLLLFLTINNFMFLFLCLKHAQFGSVFKQKYFLYHYILIINISMTGSSLRNRFHLSLRKQAY